jgi:hypothetical protein
MTRVYCDANLVNIRRNPSRGEIDVLLYGTRSQSPSGAAIGNGIRDEIMRLEAPISQRAFDFLTLAIAVTAADTFVKREDTADGWSREFELIIAIADPNAWEPIRTDLEKALHFLSGDIWHINFQDNGPSAPVPYPQGRTTRIPLQGQSCVCLYSGGLDSSTAVLDIVSQGRNPVLVSHSYRRDKAVQDVVSHYFPQNLSYFSSNLNPTFGYPAETSMRTRSLNFLAYGAVVASALAELTDNQLVDLLVPENGLISLNPPLTPRRLGSLSTRTTHPYFIFLIQKVFSLLNIPARIINPYKFFTKGEILRRCVDRGAIPRPSMQQIAPKTVSCGKWKRSGYQCGRCVPCLIRRAAFHAAGLVDSTSYRYPNLRNVYQNEDERDDLLALMLAIKKTQQGVKGSWLLMSGPLPEDRTERAYYVDVAQRGLQEVRTYLQSQGFVL